MNIANVLGNAQALLLLVFAIVLFWVAIKLAGGRASRGDVAGTAATVGSMLGPILLAAVAAGAFALSIGSGLLKSFGITP